MFIWTDTEKWMEIEPRNVRFHEWFSRSRVSMILRLRFCSFFEKWTWWAHLDKDWLLNWRGPQIQTVIRLGRQDVNMLYSPLLYRSTTSATSQFQGEEVRRGTALQCAVLLRRQLCQSLHNRPKSLQSPTPGLSVLGRISQGLFSQIWRHVSFWAIVLKKTAQKVRVEGAGKGPHTVEDSTKIGNSLKESWPKVLWITRSRGGSRGRCLIKNFPSTETSLSGKAWPLQMST